MALGRKEEKVERKRCSCVEDQGRSPYCRIHGDQKYREGAKLP